MEPCFGEYSCKDSILTSGSEVSSIILYNLIYCSNNYLTDCVEYFKCSPQIHKWFCLKPDLSRFLRKAHENNSP